jgi:hypothetical protein
MPAERTERCVIAGVRGDDGSCVIAQLVHRKPKAPVLDT